MSSLLIERIAAAAEPRGDRVAYVGDGLASAGEHVLTWGRLLRAAAALAERIRASLAAGEAVGVCLPNEPRYAVAFFGALLADCDVFPVPADIAAAELEAAMSDGGARGLIAPADVAERLQRRPDLCLAPDEVPTDGTADAADRVVPACRGDGGLLLQSSGSTGRPKIVRRGGAALDAVGENCRRALGMTADDRLLAAVPVSHSYGIDHAMLAAPLAGAAVELHGGFDAEAVARRLTDGDVTLMPGVPFMFEAVASDAVAPSADTGLRHAYSAGGPLPSSVCEAFRRRYGVAVGQIYGSTEFASVTFNDPTVEPFDPTSVGRPMEGVEIRVLETDAPRVDRPVAPGVEGQVAVAAPSMCDGYVGQATPPTEDGFFLSGDLGRLGTDGRLWITGRLKHLLDVGGRKVNPAEIEGVLREHPDVGDAVVVAVAATATVNRLKAVVTPGDATPDPATLRRFAGERLSRHKVPRRVEVWADLPRSAMGKVLRDAVERADG